MMNGGNLSFNQMGDLLIFLRKFHINESSMVKLLSFVEVANIAGVHITMDTFKGKFINVHIKDRKTIHFKAFAEGLLYTKINYPTMITNPTNVSLNAYSIYPWFKTT